MGHRPHSHVLIREPAPSGEPPNNYLGQLTVDLRVFWTPDTPPADVIEALSTAYIQAYRDYIAWLETANAPVQWCGQTHVHGPHGWKLPDGLARACRGHSGFG